MTYIPHTLDDRRKMLEAVGVERIEDLYDGNSRRCEVS